MKITNTTKQQIVPTDSEPQTTKRAASESSQEATGTQYQDKIETAERSSAFQQVVQESMQKLQEQLASTGQSEESSAVEAEEARRSRLTNTSSGQGQSGGAADSSKSGASGRSAEAGIRDYVQAQMGASDEEGYALFDIFSGKLTDTGKGDSPVPGAGDFSSLKRDLFQLGGSSAPKSTPSLYLELVPPGSKPVGPRENYTTNNPDGTKTNGQRVTVWSPEGSVREVDRSVTTDKNGNIVKTEDRYREEKEDGTVVEEKETVNWNNGTTKNEKTTTNPDGSTTTETKETKPAPSDEEKKNVKDPGPDNYGESGDPFLQKMRQDMIDSMRPKYTGPGNIDPNEIDMDAGGAPRIVPLKDPPDGENKTFGPIPGNLAPGGNIKGNIDYGPDSTQTTNDGQKTEDVPNITAEKQDDTVDADKLLND